MLWRCCVSCRRRISSFTLVSRPRREKEREASQLIDAKSLYDNNWLLLRCIESGMELRFDAQGALRSLFGGEEHGPWVQRFFSP